MKNLIMYFGKKYLINTVNDVLETHKGDIVAITSIIQTWIMRLMIIIDELKRINARVSDGKIEDDEINESVEEIENIIRDWK